MNCRSPAHANVHSKPEAPLFMACLSLSLQCTKCVLGESFYDPANPCNETAPDVQPGVCVAVRMQGSTG